jgi:hypothetical protein
MKQTKTKNKRFLEKIKIDKLFVKLTKRNKERTQINRIRDEKSNNTTIANEIQRIIMEYFNKAMF